MSMIDTTAWKEFKVKDIFNKPKVKKYGSIPKIDGDTPFISSTNRNNGIMRKVDRAGVVSNCITVTTNGSCFECFYHDYAFIPSSDVEVLQSDKLNVKNALFLCTILRQERFKYSYSNKPKNDKVWNTVIKLPVTLEGQPDYAYMEAYMESVEQEAKARLEKLSEIIVQKKTGQMAYWLLRDGKSFY